MENINEIWEAFVAKFPFTEKKFDTVVGCCKRNNIDPALFANNLFYLTGKRSAITEQIVPPTGSLIELLEYIPPAYPVTFVAAFPDVVLWFMKSYDTDEHSENPYFKELQSNREKYFDSETKGNYKFLLLLIVAFKKSGDEIEFECSF